KPFHNIKSPPTAKNSTYPKVLCNWQGWLYGFTDGKSWEDSNENKRYGYEKYFAIDNKSIGAKDKTWWMRGRVVNPFCAEQENSSYGVVTAVRAFCFYPIRSHTSDKIKDLKEKHCRGL
ncbi:MAG: hypothetical protein OYH77_06325, partial [Pseudomonadota bacterium]|nr:hypothetical protein [Pseudomonadota bacterium]